MTTHPDRTNGHSRLCSGIADHLRTRRQREAEIANALSHFLRKRTGRGPDQIRVTITDDLVIVRQQATFSAAEQHLAGTEDGAELIRTFRHKLGQALRAELSDLLETLVGLKVREAYSDTSPTGDRLDVFTLERAWEPANT